MITERIIKSHLSSRLFSGIGNFLKFDMITERIIKSHLSSRLFSGIGNFF